MKALRKTAKKVNYKEDFEEEDDDEFDIAEDESEEEEEEECEEAPEDIERKREKNGTECAEPKCAEASYLRTRVRDQRIKRPNQPSGSKDQLAQRQHSKPE